MATKLKDYTVDVTRIVHDLLGATVDVKATSPADAMRRARKLVTDGKVELAFRSQIESEPPEFEIV